MGVRRQPARLLLGGHRQRTRQRFSNLEQIYSARHEDRTADGLPLHESLAGLFDLKISSPTICLKFSYLGQQQHDEELAPRPHMPIDHQPPRPLRVLLDPLHPMAKLAPLQRQPRERC